MSDRDPYLAFLEGQHITWMAGLYSEKSDPDHLADSGTIVEGGDDKVRVQLDSNNKRVVLYAMDLAFTCNEQCIKRVMAKCLRGPSHRDLAEDETPQEIYLLKDPRTQEIRYVGISTDANKRFTQHLRCKEPNIRKNEWIKELAHLGMEPALEIIGHVRGRYTALLQEVYWTQYYLERGFDLTNEAGNE